MKQWLLRLEPIIWLLFGQGILLGTLPAGLGVNPWILLPLGCLGCWLIVRLLGKRPAATMSA